MMAYVIYDKLTTKIIGGRDKSYKTLGAAKAAISRMQNKILVSELGTVKDPAFAYAIAEINEFYKSIEKTVERTNIMTGQTFRESVNTPYFCSPSSETYWSN
jgi:hypothetical protein